MAKSESTPARKTIAPGETIELHTRFGSLSRGKCWGKFFPGEELAPESAPVSAALGVSMSDFGV